MSIEAMKQALEALDGLSEPYDVLKAQDALRTAIAEAEKQEPVAWMDASETALSWENYLDGMKPLYTTPPAAQRQPLTDEQIRDLWSWSATTEAERTANTQQHAFARAVEAAHGITGEKT